MTDKKALSDRIEMYCTQQRISCYVLAARSGVPIATIMNILNGRTKNPGIFTIDRICDGLGVSMKEFFSCESFSRKTKAQSSSASRRQTKKASAKIKTEGGNQDA